jgi:hypothetical protein
MDEPAFMDVQESGRHIQKDLSDIFRQKGILGGEQLLEIRRLDVVHQQVMCPVRLAVFDVADDELAFVQFGQGFAAAHKLASG